jgi:outer membrane lipoprotein LolB
MNRRSVLAALAALGLAACGTVGPATRPRTVFTPLPDAPFVVAGRLSARYGGEGVAANVRWEHDPYVDELLVASPIGATLARLVGQASGVRLELPDGRAAEAPDWESLTTRILGVPLPVRGLAWWIRGSPSPDSAFTAEADAAGRLEVLRQDGWEIVYAYREGEPRPQRLTLTYPGVEVRLVVDEWAS